MKEKKRFLNLKSRAIFFDYEGCVRLREVGKS